MVCFRDACCIQSFLRKGYALTLCMLGNFAWFSIVCVFFVCVCFVFVLFFMCVCVFLIFFFFRKKKKTFRNTIRVSNSLDSDQARHFVGPDLDPNCLQGLSVDDKSRH